MSNSYEFGSLLADEIRSYLKILETADKSLASYLIVFKSLDKYMLKVGTREKALTEELVSEWLHSLKCKPVTKNSYIGNLRHFARYLSALEIPAYEPEFLKAHSDFAPYTFTDEEFAAIIEAADNFSAAKRRTNSTAYVFPILLRILYGCGLRISEALNICWSDIDFTKETIFIRKAKNLKQRIVPMHSSLADLLKLFRARQELDKPNSDLLFESNRKSGEPYLDWTFRYWFLKILECAGIAVYRKKPFDHSISPHTIRHYFTYKSFLQSESDGRSLEETAPFLATYLGHDSFQGTEKYLSTNYTVYESSQKRMNESIGGLFPEVTFE
jgi:integrase